MLEEIEGFSKVEYLVAFQSIILGFIATEYFFGWGSMLRRFREIKFSGIYILFSILSFFVLLIHWWNLWYRAELLTLSIIQFIASIPYFIFYYMLVLYLFRNQKKFQEVDLYAYFQRYRVRLYTILGLYFLYDGLISVTNDDVVFTIGSLILCIVGVLFSDRRIQRLIQLLGLTLATVYILVEFLGIEVLNRSVFAPDSYSRVEHITIFISMLYGYVITEYFNGWAKLFQTIRKDWDTVFYWCWTLFAFLLLIEKWWSTWSSPLLGNPSLLNYIIILINSFSLYLISVIFFPRVLKYQNLPIYEYYLSIKKFLFPVFAIYFSLNMTVDIWQKGIPLLSAINYFRFAAIALSIMGVVYIHRSFHHSLAAISLILLIIFLIRQGMGLV